MPPLPADLDAWILSRRPAKNAVDPWRPYHVLAEPEISPEGRLEDVGAIFLTNRECPFRCLMCDLWRNTTDERVPDGAIDAQVAWGLQQLPPIARLKLYNAGNFFDPQAIPPGDLPKIAERLRSLKSVIVESHPRLIGRRCFEFQEMLEPALEVAMGLETVHAGVFEQLNKQMTVADFDAAVERLREREIGVRAFILLRPPFLDEAEGLLWAQRSLDHAFDIGVECCVIIPTRAGNGAMDDLLTAGAFHPPTIRTLELAVEHGVRRRAGRVFADLWDIERFVTCPDCDRRRIVRLNSMNLTQRIAAAIECHCGDLAP